MFNACAMRSTRCIASRRKARASWPSGCIPTSAARPHRVKYFDAILAYMKKHKDVVFWQGEQIYDWYVRAVGDRETSRWVYGLGGEGIDMSEAVSMQVPSPSNDCVATLRALCDRRDPWSTRRGRID
jgi:hypothetical protein